MPIPANSNNQQTCEIVSEDKLVAISRIFPYFGLLEKNKKELYSS